MSQEQTQQPPSPPALGSGFYSDDEKHNEWVDKAVRADPSWWMDTIPSPPFDKEAIEKCWHAMTREIHRLRALVSHHVTT